MDILHHPSYFENTNNQKDICRYILDVFFSKRYRRRYLEEGQMPVLQQKSNIARES